MDLLLFISQHPPTSASRKWQYIDTLNHLRPQVSPGGLFAFVIDLTLNQLNEMTVFSSPDDNKENVENGDATVTRQ